MHSRCFETFDRKHRCTEHHRPLRLSFQADQGPSAWTSACLVCLPDRLATRVACWAKYIAGVTLISMRCEMSKCRPDAAAEETRRTSSQLRFCWTRCGRPLYCKVTGLRAADCAWRQQTTSRRCCKRLHTEDCPLSAHLGSAAVRACGWTETTHLEDHHSRFTRRYASFPTFSDGTLLRRRKTESNTDPIPTPRSLALSLSCVTLQKVPGPGA